MVVHAHVCAGQCAMMFKPTLHGYDQRISVCKSCVRVMSHMYGERAVMSCVALQLCASSVHVGMVHGGVCAGPGCVP